ncbi:MAG: hypothetical protein U1C50_02790 [Patescibacteria group bacterium]|nr:hypothetical protein [Patescibacteria group bacterium]MDZ4229157.1 hypothetical protein [Patescibacteria group bacterium]
MSFEPASPLSIIVCNQCQGKGCSACDQLGVYAQQDEQIIAFNLPDFIDLKTRKFLRRLFIIKRVVLIGVALALIIIAWSLIYA